MLETEKAKLTRATARLISSCAHSCRMLRIDVYWIGLQLYMTTIVVFQEAFLLWAPRYGYLNPDHSAINGKSTIRLFNSPR